MSAVNTKAAMPELSHHLLYAKGPLSCPWLHTRWCHYTLPGYTTNTTTMPSLQVLLNIVNFSKTKSLYREGLGPVVCSRRRPQWNVRLANIVAHRRRK